MTAALSKSVLSQESIRVISFVLFLSFLFLLIMFWGEYTLPRSRNLTIQMLISLEAMGVLEQESGT